MFWTEELRKSTRIVANVIPSLDVCGRPSYGFGIVNLARMGFKLYLFVNKIEVALGLDLQRNHVINCRQLDKEQEWS